MLLPKCLNYYISYISKSLIKIKKLNLFLLFASNVNKIYGKLEMNIFITEEA